MVVGDLPEAVDVLVLGGGPAGCAAALRAAQMGRQVTLVSPGPLGGGWAQEGVPGQHLLRAAAAGAGRGRQAQGDLQGGGARTPDWGPLGAAAAAKGRKAAAEVAEALAAHRVQVIQGTGRFTGSDRVWVEGEAGGRTYTFQACVVATGAAPQPLPGRPFDGQENLTPRQALALPALPSHLAVVGCGGEAAALAALFARLGAVVTLDLHGGTLLPGLDPELRDQVQAGLQALGVRLEPAPPGVPAVVCLGGDPRTGDLNLAAAGVAVGPGGAVAVDAQMRTANPAVYAAGAAAGAPALPAVAAAQGRVAAGALCGHADAYDPQAVPRWVPADPEVAQVGLGPAEAQERGLPVVVGRAPGPCGYAAVVADARSGALLGALAVGPGAGEVVAQAALALEMGATLTDLALTLAPWPAAAGALAAAAWAALGQPVAPLP